ncbi:uncharacterized protein FIBRA_05373 [Fibroporia radiculosa]|uniref:Uncharacterized protein n=1 Tax=Fibroporia radiculosa TaxID=599839 RepID=J4HXE7_9APHY|nr:uncharacterized protein FIBRA_05373 [Fibroporia radiculosa]CCM03247.1 predicted protein [Fibroporia radiculosa]
MDPEIHLSVVADPSELGRYHQSQKSSNEGQRSYLEFEPVTSVLETWSPQDSLALSPIHSLPVETLANIFWLLAESMSSSFPASLSSRVASYSWIQVTRVCRYWRTTALAYSSLWAILDTAQPRFVRTALTRAGSAPLKVILRDGIYEAYIAATLEDTLLRAQIAERSDQIEELHIEPRFKYGPGLLEAFYRPAPALRSLIIKNCHGRQHHELPRMFDGYTPILARLEIWGFSAWPENMFINLTHLCLRDQPKHLRPPLRTFLDMLAACPLLECLILVDAGPTADEGDPSADESPRVVPLAMLRNLDIGHWSSAKLIARFLRCLDLPSTAVVHFWAMPLFPSYEITDIGQLLPDNLALLLPFHNLHTIVIMPPTKPQGCGMFSEHPDLQALTVCDGALHMLGDFPVYQTLYPLLCKLDLQYVRIFISYKTRNLDPDKWPALLSRMPRLSSLTVVPNSMAALFALFPTIPDGQDLPLPCPALQSLTVMEHYERAGSLWAVLVLGMAAQGRRLTQLKRIRIIEDIPSTYASQIYWADDLENGQLEFISTQDHLDSSEFAPTSWPSEAYKWSLNRRRLAGFR